MAYVAPLSPARRVQIHTLVLSLQSGPEKDEYDISDDYNMSILWCRSISLAATLISGPGLAEIMGEFRLEKKCI